MTVSVRVCVCVRVSLLISVFAKWTKWEPTGSCALHFFLLSFSLPLQSQDAHTIRAALISPLIIGLNHREPSSTGTTQQTQVYSLPFPVSLGGRAAPALFLPSHKHTQTHWKHSTAADQTNKLQAKTTRKRGFALTLYFQWWTKKYKLLGAPLPLHQWQRKINK